MAQFMLKRGKPVPVGELLFEAGVPVDVTDENLVRKLRGHKSFEEVPTP